MKRSGLERHRWIDSIDDFVRQHGRATPRWALFLTYELDLDRLARAVLPVLARRGRHFRSVVLSDQATLEKSLKLWPSKLPGAVNLHPVRCKRGGVFHPKLVFLRAGRHVRACFGSANLTDGGLGSNLELWSSSESPEILAGLQHFLLGLTRSPDLAIDEGACRSLRRALSGLGERETPSVWSSLQESFASRLRSGPERRAASTTIISPMYAGEVGIKAARAAIPTSEVHLHTSIAVRLRETSVLVYSPPHVADQSDDDAEAFPRILHAKAYVFRPRAGGAALAWLGSANFTALALTKRVSKGGNVELMVRTQLPKDEADALDVDLRTLFKKGTAVGNEAARDTSAPARPVATILACELVETADGLRLLIHAIHRDGHVVLVNGGRQARVIIKNGRGVLEGAELCRLLPDVDLTLARPLRLYQLLRGEQVPIVANVPHVPPDDCPEGRPQASLDALLDDLLGRVPIPQGNSGFDGESEEETDSSNEDVGDRDSRAVEFERRLDQVRHQGEIDQLAVKAALLKKLAIRTTASGLARDDVLSDIVRLLLAASPRHLAPVIQALFGHVDVSESR